MEVVDLVQTCGSCPSQWEARTEDNRPVYVRYRWGYLSVVVGEPGETINQAINSGVEIVGEQLGGEYDGTLSWHRVARLLDPLDLDAVLEAKRRARQEWEEQMADPEYRQAEEFFAWIAEKGLSSGKPPASDPIEQYVATAERHWQETHRV
jgi:hypothetical protein